MAERAKIFLVDEHEIVLRGLRQLLAEQTDLEICGQALAPRAALTGIARTRPDLAIVDLSLGQSSGLELLKDLATQHPVVHRLVLTAHNDLEMVTRVMRTGTRGYLCKNEACDSIVLGIRAVLAGQTYISPKLASQLAGAVFLRGQPVDGELPALSDRERQIFELMAGGALVNQIATILNISPKTVHTHRDHMKAKFGVPDGHALELLAVRWKIRHEPHLPGPSDAV